MDSFTALFDDLDRSGPLPLYFQVARRIEGAIESGMLPAGTKLENELKLADDLKLSRPTIRRAIQELVSNGLLVRRRGIGTQVVHGKITRKVELSSLFDDLARDHKVPTTQLLLHELVTPSGDVMEALDLSSPEPILHIKRLRKADGDPMALLENYLPAELSDITAEQLERQGLYQILRARGTTMRVAKQRIGAREATEEEAGLFNRPAGSPVLTMARTLYDDGGRAVEYGVHSYPPETYSFEITLVET
ncbi:GntR family transcriptional regulator [Plantibacter sp. Mn2098]|uniref:GntR family transcriptional regulator n=1 Tax=Plantibacter sp. Mn2098 TaxID=3395266 RepID=UPI003BD47347